MTEEEFTPAQRALIAMWERHMAAEFADGRVAGERIYWDQATVLAQLGLIDGAGLPVAGAEAARKVRDVRSEPSNRLLERAGGTP